MSNRSSFLHRNGAALAAFLALFSAASAFADASSDRYLLEIFQKGRIGDKDFSCPDITKAYHYPYCSVLQNSLLLKNPRNFNALTEDEYKQFSERTNSDFISLWLQKVDESVKDLINSFVRLRGDKDNFALYLKFLYRDQPPIPGGNQYSCSNDGDPSCVERLTKLYQKFYRGKLQENINHAVSAYRTRAERKRRQAEETAALEEARKMIAPADELVRKNFFRNDQVCGCPSQEEWTQLSGVYNRCSRAAANDKLQGEYSSFRQRYEAYAHLCDILDNLKKPGEMNPWIVVLANQYRANYQSVLQRCNIRYAKLSKNQVGRKIVAVGQGGPPAPGEPKDLGAQITGVAGQVYDRLVQGQCDEGTLNLVRRILGIYRTWNAAARKERGQFMGDEDSDAVPAPKKSMDRLRDYDLLCREFEEMRKIGVARSRAADSGQKDALSVELRGHYQIFIALLTRLHSSYAGTKNASLMDHVAGNVGVRMPLPKKPENLLRLFDANRNALVNKDPFVGTKVSGDGSSAAFWDASHPAQGGNVTWLTAHPNPEGFKRVQRAGLLAAAIGTDIGHPEMTAAITQFLLDYVRSDTVSVEWFAGKKALKITYRTNKPIAAFYIGKATRSDAEANQAALHLDTMDDKTAKDLQMKLWVEYLQNGKQNVFYPALFNKEKPLIIRFYRILKQRYLDEPFHPPLDSRGHETGRELIGTLEVPEPEADPGHPGRAARLISAAGNAIGFVGLTAGSSFDAAWQFFKRPYNEFLGDTEAADDNALNQAADSIKPPLMLVNWGLSFSDITKTMKGMDAQLAQYPRARDRLNRLAREATCKEYAEGMRQAALRSGANPPKPEDQLLYRLVCDPKLYDPKKVTPQERLQYLLANYGVEAVKNRAVMAIAGENGSWTWLNLSDVTSAYAPDLAATILGFKLISAAGGLVFANGELIVSRVMLAQMIPELGQDAVMLIQTSLAITGNTTEEKKRTVEALMNVVQFAGMVGVHAGIAKGAQARWERDFLSRNEDILVLLKMTMRRAGAPQGEKELWQSVIIGYLRVLTRHDVPYELRANLWDLMRARIRNGNGPDIGGFPEIRATGKVVDQPPPAAPPPPGATAIVPSGRAPAPARPSAPAPARRPGSAPARSPPPPVKTPAPVPAPVPAPPPAGNNPAQPPAGGAPAPLPAIVDFKVPVGNHTFSLRANGSQGYLLVQQGEGPSRVIAIEPGKTLIFDASHPGPFQLADIPRNWSLVFTAKLEGGKVRLAVENVRRDAPETPVRDLALASPAVSGPVRLSEGQRFDRGSQAAVYRDPRDGAVIKVFNDAFVLGSGGPMVRVEKRHLEALVGAVDKLRKAGLDIPRMELVEASVDDGPARWALRILFVKGAGVFDLKESRDSLSNLVSQMLQHDAFAMLDRIDQLTGGLADRRVKGPLSEEEDFANFKVMPGGRLVNIDPINMVSLMRNMAAQAAVPVRASNRGISQLRGENRNGQFDPSRASFPGELLDVSLLRGQRVLDVGSGRGRFVEELRQAGVDAVGLDPNVKNKPGLVVPGLGENLPFDSNSIGIYYSNWSVFFLDRYQGSACLPFLREAARVVRPGGKIRIAAVHAENLEAILREIPGLGLSLSPDLELRPSPVYDNGPFKGMRYQVYWKGRPWLGRPFLELVKAPGVPVVEHPPIPPSAPFIDSSVLIRAARGNSPDAIKFLADHPVVLITGQHVFEAFNLSKVKNPEEAERILTQLSRLYDESINSGRVRVQSVVQVPLDKVEAYAALRERVAVFLRDKHQVSRKDSAMLAGVILQSRGRQVQFATFDGALTRKMQSLRANKAFQRDLEALGIGAGAEFQGLSLPEPVFLRQQPAAAPVQLRVAGGPAGIGGGPPASPPSPLGRVVQQLFGPKVDPRLAEIDRLIASGEFRQASERLNRLEEDTGFISAGSNGAELQKRVQNLIKARGASYDRGEQARQGHWKKEAQLQESRGTFLGFPSAKTAAQKGPTCAFCALDNAIQATQGYDGPGGVEALMEISPRGRQAVLKNGITPGDFDLLLKDIRIAYRKISEGQPVPELPDMFLDHLRRKQPILACLDTRCEMTGDMHEVFVRSAFYDQGFKTWIFGVQDSHTARIDYYSWGRLRNLVKIAYFLEITAPVRIPRGPLGAGGETAGRAPAAGTPSAPWETIKQEVFDELARKYHQYGLTSQTVDEAYQRLEREAGEPLERIFSSKVELLNYLEKRLPGIRPILTERIGGVDRPKTPRSYSEVLQEMARLMLEDPSKVVGDFPLMESLAKQNFNDCAVRHIWSHPLVRILGRSGVSYHEFLALAEKITGVDTRKKGLDLTRQQMLLRKMGLKFWDQSWAPKTERQLILEIKKTMGVLASIREGDYGHAIVISGAMFLNGEWKFVVIDSIADLEIGSGSEAKNPRVLSFSELRDKRLIVKPLDYDVRQGDMPDPRVIVSNVRQLMGEFGIGVVAGARPALSATPAPAARKPSAGPTEESGPTAAEPAPRGSVHLFDAKPGEAYLHPALGMIIIEKVSAEELAYKDYYAQSRYPVILKNPENVLLAKRGTPAVDSLAARRFSDNIGRPEYLPLLFAYEALKSRAGTVQADPKKRAAKTAALYEKYNRILRGKGLLGSEQELWDLLRNDIEIGLISDSEKVRAQAVEKLARIVAAIYQATGEDLVRTGVLQGLDRLAGYASGQKVANRQNYAQPFTGMPGSLQGIHPWSSKNYSVWRLIGLKQKKILTHLPVDVTDRGIQLAWDQGIAAITPAQDSLFFARPYYPFSDPRYAADQYSQTLKAKDAEQAGRTVQMIEGPIREFAQRLGEKGDYLVVPVPSKNGEGSSALLARALAQRLGLQENSSVLAKRKDAEKQKDLSFMERLSNAGLGFILTKTGSSPIQGKTVILVDDVYTTGASIQACARLLIDGGADKVLVFIFGKTTRGSDGPAPLQPPQVLAQPPPATQLAQSQGPEVAKGEGDRVVSWEPAPLKKSPLEALGEAWKKEYPRSRSFYSFKEFIMGRPEPLTSDDVAQLAKRVGIDITPDDMEDMLLARRLLSWLGPHRPRNTSEIPFDKLFDFFDRERMTPERIGYLLFDLRLHVPAFSDYKARSQIEDRYQADRYKTSKPNTVDVLLQEYQGFSVFTFKRFIRGRSELLTAGDIEEAAKRRGLQLDRAGVDDLLLARRFLALFGSSPPRAAGEMPFDKIMDFFDRERLGNEKIAQLLFDLEFVPALREFTARTELLDRYGARKSRSLTLPPNKPITIAVGAGASAQGIVIRRLPLGYIEIRGKRVRRLYVGKNGGIEALKVDGVSGELVVVGLDREANRITIRNTLGLPVRVQEPGQARHRPFSESGEPVKYDKPKPEERALPLNPGIIRAMFHDVIGDYPKASDFERLFQQYDIGLEAARALMKAYGTEPMLTNDIPSEEVVRQRSVFRALVRSWLRSAKPEPLGENRVREVELAALYDYPEGSTVFFWIGDEHMKVSALPGGRFSVVGKDFSRTLNRGDNVLSIARGGEITLGDAVDKGGLLLTIRVDRDTLSAERRDSSERVYSLSNPSLPITEDHGVTGRISIYFPVGNVSYIIDPNSPALRDLAHEVWQYVLDRRTKHVAANKGPAYVEASILSDVVLWIGKNIEYDLDYIKSLRSNHLDPIDFGEFVARPRKGVCREMGLLAAYLVEELQWRMLLPASTKVVEVHGPSHGWAIAETSRAVYVLDPAQQSSALRRGLKEHLGALDGFYRYKDGEYRHAPSR
ncbi:MAG: methyltransferase domain-containing protein [Elusimicrobia bacterium]|nr:methyltransferase domain-containing protein [Elusimicrobiota bacterium]